MPEIRHILGSKLLKVTQAQRIQSARLSVQSSELGPPLTHMIVLLPPNLGPRGETHLLARERVGEPNSDDDTDTLVL
jgi:hypothetical protein